MRAILHSFLSFCDHYAAQVPEKSIHTNLKRDHSLRVHALAYRIARAEQVRDVFPFRLAALVHDIGRFPQFITYGTYRDADSVDHGDLGAELLEQNRFLDFVSEDLRKLIIAVVRWHNKKDIPEHLDSLTHAVLTVVRDADKLDIIPVILKTLKSERLSEGVVTMGLMHEPSQWSPKIVDQVYQGQKPAYADLRFTNDFLILLSSWGQQLNHAASQRIFVQRGYLDKIFAFLPDHADFIQLKTILASRLADH